MDWAFSFEGLIEVFSTAVGVPFLKQYRNLVWDQRSILRLSKMLAATPLPQDCCGAFPENPLADVGMRRSMPRAAVEALTFPLEQVECQLTSIVAD